MDGWALLGMCLVFLAQALLHGEKEAKQELVAWWKKEIGLAVAGLAVLAFGAHFTALATKNIFKALGISMIVGTFFITVPMYDLPEVFATWGAAKAIFPA